MRKQQILQLALMSLEVTMMMIVHQLRLLNQLQRWKSRSRITNKQKQLEKMLLAEMKMEKKDREVEEREIGDIEEETLAEKVVKISEVMIRITEVDREDQDNRDLQLLK